MAREKDRQEKVLAILKILDCWIEHLTLVKLKSAVPKVVKHWEENLVLAEDGKLEMKDIKYPKCALCDIFNSHKSCDARCPLKETTKKICCSEWRVVYKALEEFLKNLSSENSKIKLVLAVEAMLERVQKIQY